GFVVDLDDYVFAEVLQGDFRAQSRSDLPHLVRPFLELGIVGHAASARDRVEFRPTRRLSRRGRIAALAMLHQLGGAAELRYCAPAGDVAAVPFDPKLEALVRIEALWIDRKLRHARLLER